MACAWLGEDDPPRGIGVDGDRWREVTELVRTGVASPLTTSVGRLFDAVSALCGMCSTATYEGQAAVELEAAADRCEQGAYPLSLVDGDAIVLDARETVRAAQEESSRGAPVGQVSARFHNGLASATAKACKIAAERHAVGTVVLCGGVFQNKLLLERTADLLERSRLRVLVPRLLPPNDGGIAYGQAAIAAALGALG
jgi:hydrogenase maturation protein HypF